MSGNGANSRPSEKNEGGANGDMNGGRDEVDIIGPNPFPFPFAISAVVFDAFLELGRSASCDKAPSDDGDAADADDDVTVDDVGAREQRDVDVDDDADDDAPPGIANGWIMDGRSKPDADDTPSAPSLSLAVCDFVPSLCLPSLPWPPSAVLLVLVLVVLSV